MHLLSLLVLKYSHYATLNKREKLLSYFVKLPKANVSLCFPVCHSVRMEPFASRWTDLHEITITYICTDTFINEIVQYEFHPTNVTCSTEQNAK